MYLVSCRLYTDTYAWLVLSKTEECGSEALTAMPKPGDVRARPSPTKFLAEDPDGSDDEGLPAEIMGSFQPSRGPVPLVHVELAIAMTFVVTCTAPSQSSLS